MKHRHGTTRPARMGNQDGATLRLEVCNEGLSEWVEVWNEGHVDQPLTDWSLASLHGQKVFRFPDGLVLGAGARIRITSGEGVTHRPPAVYGWTDEQVWNNRGDMAFLFDPDGREAARHAYRRASRGARVPSQELIRDEDGGYKLVSRRRPSARNRPKFSRTGRNKT